MSVFSSPASLAIAICNGIARTPKGGTLYRTANHPDNGYVVRHGAAKSLTLAPRSVKRVRLFEPRSTATSAVLGWVKHNWKAITSADCVGFWLDENGTIWIDANRVIGDLDKAIAHGEKLGELALFDLAKGRAVPLV